MHVKPVPQPRLRLPAHLALHALPIPRGDQMRREVIAEVLDDRARLGQDEGFGQRGRLDGDDGRFAQGVDFLERGRGEHVGLAFVDFDGPVEVVAFLQQPDDALGAGFVQPVVVLVS